MDLTGIVQDGVVVFEGDSLPDGTRVTVAEHDGSTVGIRSGHGRRSLGHTDESAADPLAAFDPASPPWLLVEQDLYFPMTVPAVSLGTVRIRIEDGMPSIILPEEVSDD